jgi:hypothetical protein
MNIYSNKDMKTKFIFIILALFFTFLCNAQTTKK